MGVDISERCYSDETANEIAGAARHNDYFSGRPGMVAVRHDCHSTLVAPTPVTLPVTPPVARADGEPAAE